MAPVTAGARNTWILCCSAHGLLRPYATCRLLCCSLSERIHVEASIKCTSSLLTSRITQAEAMEKRGGGGNDPATRAAGGMCDRFLTFLTRNLTMSKVKSIADVPKNGGGGADHTPSEGVEEGEEEDEFAIPIERAEFDYEFGGGYGDGGYSSAATILEESAATGTTRDVPEPKTAASAADDPVGGAGPAPAAMAAEGTKVRKTVTIKEDRPPEQAGGAPAAPLERKRSLFKKRQASSAAGGGGDEQRVPRRSGLRPRMPPVLRVPSNINERSSTFIEERKKSFVARGGAKPAPDK